MLQDSIIKQKDFKVGCILSCCFSCSFCSFMRASAKERSKTRSLSEQNKACQRCMLCKSMPFCPVSSQCPQCCLRTECRGKITKFLASLAKHGFESSGSLYPQGGLHSSLQTKAPFDKVPLDAKRLLKSNQEHVPKRSSYKSLEQVGSRKGGCQVVSGLLQPSFSGSQTKEKMEADLRSESSQFIPQHRHFQNGDSRDNLVVLGNRGVDHIAGLQRLILPHSHCPKVKKVSQVLPVQSNLSVHSSSLRVGHSSPRVHQGGQRSETHGSSTGYQNPPVPRRLVTESPFPGDLPTTYPDPLGPVSTVGLGSKYDKIGISPQTGLQFCRLPVRPDHQSSSTHSRPVGSTSGETKVHKGTSQLYSQAIHVPDRPFNCHGEAGVFRLSSYEAHSMASEETLAHSGGVREGYSGPSVTPPPSGLVARRDQCAERTALAPSSACCSTVYRRLKRRVGRTLRGLHCKRHLVIHGKSPSYKLSGTEGSPPGSATVRASAQGSDCACCNGQHNSGIVHKQAGVRLSLCPPVEASVLVPPERYSPEGKAHSRSLECDSGQAFQTQSSYSNRVVPISADVHSLVFQVDPTSGGLVCNPVQSQTTTVCLTGTGSDSLGSRCLESTVGSIGGVRLSPRVSDPPGNLKVEGSGLSQDDPHCSRMAKHALVLGPSESVQVQIPFRLPLVRDLVTQPFNGVLHRNLNNLNLHAWLLDSLPSRNTGSLMKWQQELRLLREAQPEPYTSQSGPFFLNGASHTRWMPQGALCKPHCRISSTPFQRKKSQNSDCRHGGQ